MNNLFYSKNNSNFINRDGDANYDSELKDVRSENAAEQRARAAELRRAQSYDGGNGDDSTILLTRRSTRTQHKKTCNIKQFLLFANVTQHNYFVFYINIFFTI